MWRPCGAMWYSLAINLPPPPSASSFRELNQTLRSGGICPAPGGPPLLLLLPSLQEGRGPITGARGQTSSLGGPCRSCDMPVGPGGEEEVSGPNCGCKTASGQAAAGPFGQGSGIKAAGRHSAVSVSFTPSAGRAEEAHIWQEGSPPWRLVPRAEKKTKWTERRRPPKKPASLTKRDVGMGSGASVSEEPRPERLQAGEAEAEPVRPSTPAGRSDDTLQADEEAVKRDSHIMEVQSLKSEESNRHRREEEEEEEEEEERITQTVMNPAVTETVAEGEEVSLDFESFLHNNGTLYSCFNHHGNRVYVDESQNLQPFPKEWYNQGRFITASNEGSGQLQTPASSQPVVREDDRTSSIYIQGKGTVMTYMFEERVNICRFWDPLSGVWLLLPLQWEMNVEFVKARVQRVMSTLPGLVDQKEITAALRQCNYDSEEVISVYLTMFGEILLQAPPSGDHTYADLNSFRRKRFDG
ncbi:kinesin-like protein KIFC3 isoform X2 [Lates japonicus]|uniref:Kinesin-like protein KIFC3 isoform X2 n=1 Tax=Lates japonicus TaxID=270547 RepID=A0AAD3R357_LATJO|nr:kinesin-like protein KIFC3 isoform X2 [Lates japonicus]